QQGAAGVLHFVRGAHVCTGEDPCLVEVRRHERRQRNQSPGDQLLRLARQQPVSGGRHHDGVEHVVGEPVPLNPGGDGLDQLGVAEHPAFDRGGRQVLGDRVELAGDQRGGQCLPGEHPRGVLGGDGAHHARPEDAELMKGLEIGLDAGPAPRIRAGDRQGDSHGSRLAGRPAPAMLQVPGPRERTIPGNLQSAVRDLQRRKARSRRRLALIEGIRLVEEALAAELTFRGALIAPDLDRTSRGASLRAELVRHSVPIEETAARAFAALAATDTPQGVLAIIEPRDWTVAELPTEPGRVLLVLDGVQDPGNVGTLIRTAHALGAGGTVALRGTADVLNPKALRAAMGATFRHPVVSLDDAAFISWAHRAGVTLWATAADGEPLPRGVVETESAGPVAVIVGNEGAGIRPALNAVAAKRVAIPLAAGAESLNVAVAAGILLY